jgi:glycosyltransferase involved in cell wall biosynthesis
MEAGRVADSVHLVVPCFNERERLDLDQLRALCADGRISLVFVDDGSTDGTADVLRALQRDAAGVSLVALPHNQGKGAAVRAGLVHALAADPEWVGYLDADMSTPAVEIIRLIDLATATERFDVVLGSRLALLGRDIHRSPFRHYTGRVFATFASLVLHKAVYDTQCGAKLFRRTPAVAAAVATPFRSRWAFDVELLGRLHDAGTAPARFWEEPLLAWHDRSGSRRTLAASVRASIDLLAIRRDLRGSRG